MQVGDFLESVYMRKALVCHGAVSRLEELKKDFHGFSDEALLNNLANQQVNVWVRP
tara:strand:+ start:1016 stop:1183 length:168 start_codon:yes stop_codon:yes gene_type:complete